MKADWIIRIEMSRFFDRHKELRVRVSQGVLEDRILFGVFDKTLRAEFSIGEIIKAEKLGYIIKKSIAVDRSVRTVWGWTEKPCSYQPIWYKRWYGKVKTYLAERLSS